MSITVYKQGQTIKTTVHIKDWNGNYNDPDATPVCKVYFGAAVEATLSVSKTEDGIYYAYHNIAIDDDIGSYTVVWTWKEATMDDLVSIPFRVESYL